MVDNIAHHSVEICSARLKIYCFVS